MDLSELFQAIVKHVMDKTMYHCAYRYRVIEQVGDLVSLQAVGAVAGLPGQLMLPKAHGLAGTTETLSPSTLVLVMFEGGDPGAPFVAHILPKQSMPRAISIESKDTAAFIAVDRVYVGGDDMKEAAVGPLVDNRLSTLLTGINSALGALGIPSIPPLGSVSSAKVFITTGDGKPVDPHAP